MSTQQKNGSNGTASTNGKTNGKPVATSTTLTPVKKEDQNPAPSVPGHKLTNDLPPVEDRILKVNHLFSLVEKHETLLETKKKLKSFKLSTDGSRDVLRIQDSKGNEFTTSNSACIADVLEVLKASIDKKIIEVEAQIKF